MILTKYKKYSAVITLKAFQVFASNQVVEQELQKAGFTNVTVTGDGKYRQATGVWGRETQQVNENDFGQISNIQEV